ncbi:MAG TPA: protein-disulfide reductase DsbD family protein, partial [Gemmatales bacterium]|nr:protein-disulfide reductase DsbD family protein [Gemmatales bacterium]
MSWNAILSGFVLAALLLPAPALAQIDDNPFLPGGGGMPGDLASERLQLLAELAPLKVARGGKVTFTLTLLPRSGFHTYPAIQKDPQAESFVTEIEVKGPARTVGLPEQSAPEYKDEPGIGTVGMYEHRGTIAWTLQVDEAAPLGPTKLTVTVNTQVCDKSCVPVNKKFDFEVTIEEGTPGTPTDSPAVPPSASSPRPAERPAETSVDAKQLRSEYEAIVTRLLEVNSGRGA